MKRYLSLALMWTVLALLATGVAWADTTEEELFERTVSVDDGGLVSVKNTNGHIYVEAWDRGEVEIRALKKARARYGDDAMDVLGDIEVRVSEAGGNVTIDTELPKGRWGRGTSASVEYEIKVPASVRLKLKSTNGKVEAEGVSGDVEITTTNGGILARRLGGNLMAETTNGKIDALDVAGAIEAETTNGSIRAEMTGDMLAEDVELSTTNGSVELRLSANVAARIDARAGNGSVRSDLPLRVEGRERRNSLTGDLNGGGPTIRIRTSNGSIRLRER